MDLSADFSGDSKMHTAMLVASNNFYSLLFGVDGALEEGEGAGNASCVLGIAEGLRGLKAWWDSKSG